jgi:hypothetical protein
MVSMVILASHDELIFRFDHLISAGSSTGPSLGLAFMGRTQLEYQKAQATTINIEYDMLA